MGNGIYNAVSGAVAQTRVIEVVANNLANISTAGFKADRISFAEVLSKASKQGIPDGGSFTKTDEVRMDLRPKKELRVSPCSELAPQSRRRPCWPASLRPTILAC